MKNKQVAKVTVVDYADKSFLGLMTPDGEYRISMVEILTLFFDCTKVSFVQLKESTKLDLCSCKKLATELTEQTANKLKIQALSLDDVVSIASVLASKGNEDAKLFVLANEVEPIEAAITKAFDYKIKYLSAA